MFTRSAASGRKGFPLHLTLSLLLVATLLCRADTAPDNGAPLPSPLTPVHFEQLFAREIDGYQIQSGLLRHVDNSEAGSLVAVKGTDGSLTAIYEHFGKGGLLKMVHAGQAQILPDAPSDFDGFDALPPPPEAEPGSDTSIQPTTPPEENTPRVISILIGFSRLAVDRIGDPQAYALAQVESVNLALYRSKISDVSLELAGIEIIDQDYPITADTLRLVDQLFPASKFLGADLTTAFFLGNSDDSAPSLAYSPGRLSIQSIKSSIALRHSLGHNAGGGHCNDTGSGYNFGYNNGKTQTIMCGNASSYYSNPDVLDQFGLPVGDANTANMARVWRENALRLSSYAALRKPSTPQSQGGNSQ